MKERRLAIFDAMRSLAMVGVIGFHVGELIWGKGLFFPLSFDELFRNWQSANWSAWYILTLMGDHAVTLFLFLSGYLLIFNKTEFNLKWFGRRMRKLLFPFWIAVIGGSLLTAWVWRVDPEIIRRGVGGEFAWDKVIWAGLLVQNWTAYTFNAPVPAWWFVGILVQLYLLAGFLKYILDKASSKTFFKIIIGGQLVWNLVVMVIFSHTSWLYFGYYNGLSYLALFGLGMWSARYKVSLGGGAGLMMVFGGWGLRLIGGRWFMLSEAIIGMGWFMVLEWFIPLLGKIWPKLIENLAWMGRRWSYYVYLWHQPILWFVIWIIRNNGWGLAW